MQKNHFHLLHFLPSSSLILFLAVAVELFLKAMTVILLHTGSFYSVQAFINFLVL